MKNNSPKVFICHAKEDKERFVVDLATKLREKGIDAWLDKWEMRGGDSIVKRIFDEGIGGCDVFIIILSKNSINKKWVREELDSAVVKRIEGDTRIIPIIIDENIEVPQSLKHLLWRTIKDTSNYEDKLKTIILDIHGMSEKPALGEKSKFLVDMPLVEGLTKTDSIVLKIIGDTILQENNTIRFLNLGDIIRKGQKLEISKDEIIESVEILDSEGYLEMRGSRDFSPLIVTPFGFVEYCKYFLGNFDAIFLDVISLIINSDLKSSVAISSKIGCELVIAVSLLDYFHDEGFIKVTKAKGIPSNIFKIYAEGRRYFKSILENNREI